MTCTHIGTAIICHSPFYRLPLSDGRRIFMEWHNYFGPTFFHDRKAMRQIDEWWGDELICEALDWFSARGERA